MKTSFFVLWLSMLCIVILTTCTVTAHVTMVDSQLTTHVVEDKVVTSADTCNCVDCESRIIGTQGFLTLGTVRCEYGKSPLITKITMDISSITPKKFSYYVVDERNLNLALSGKPFIYDTNRSKMNNQNCTTDSVISRYRTAPSVIVKVEDLVEGEDLVDIYYDIQATCGPVPANSMEINTATEYNSKHYIGSTVRLDVTFYNSELDSVDTLLKGTIQVKGSKIQQGDVKKGRSRLYLTLLDEFFEADSILVEFVQNPKLNQNIRLPLVKKGAKGEILVHKNQQIYSGKEFTLYFQLFDSDNGVTPTIDIPSLSIASPNNNLYCQVTNYLNGYGFATCENIDTPGEHSLVLKYNGAVLHEKTIAVQENPYQYINEAIVLLLVILVIVSLLILCVGVVSFIIFYKKLNKGNGKNTSNKPQGRFIREEDAEELDNM